MQTPSHTGGPAVPSRSPSLLALLVVAVAALAFPASIRAQAAPGPRLDAQRAGIHAPLVTTPAVLEVSLPQPAVARKRGVPQMIIGGAALVGGALIGGDAGTIVMLGGLGYGLYGLYLYLQ
jgi:hypothetical protein